MGQPLRSRPEPPLAGVEIGAVIAGKYRVERVIGEGGMGVVVAASQIALERMVAIKLIRSDCAQDPLAVERLLREAKAAASIQSEHVAKVLDVGRLDRGVPFIVMEYLEGSDLQTLLDRDGPLQVAEAVDFILQACEAIAEAHRNGIVHRDIKPANLFIARSSGSVPRVKVVDFGISKMIGLESLESLTQPLSVVGSLYHMAPEQMRGARVDARTDVWAIGLLLFEMLTGRKPFRHEAWPAVCAQILNEEGPLLQGAIEGIPEELQAVIEKCLRRLPQDRYDNVAELAVRLTPFGRGSARLSLECIVRLATSTGSLSAHSLASWDAGLPGAAGVALENTRPVLVPPEELAGARQQSGGMPRTPVPVSALPSVLVAWSRRRPVIGVAVVACVVAPALMWLWWGPPGLLRSEEHALSPAAPAPVGVIAEPRAAGSAWAVPPPIPDATLSAVESKRGLRASGDNEGSSEGALPAAATQAEGSPPGAPPGAAAPSPRRSPLKSRPPSAWDLDDIGF
jgi:serine/threonine protein kinase